jgi:hypothetical protein
MKDEMSNKSNTAQTREEKRCGIVFIVHLPDTEQ